MSQTKAQLISDLVQALAFTATASAPTNGMFLSASNTLAISTNSTQRLTVDSDGHVGIAETSPSTYSAGSGIPTLVLKGNSGTYTDRSGAIAFLSQDDGSTGKTWMYHDTDFYIQSTTATNIRFLTNNSERARIDSSGNVGIGTSSPSGKLHVNGTGIFDSAITAKTYIQGHSSALTFYGDSTAGSEDAMVLTSSGRLGVGGISSPATTLDVQDSIRIRKNASNLAKLEFQAASTRIEYSDASGNLEFYTNSSRRAFVGYLGGFNVVSGGLSLTAGNITFSGADRSITNNDSNALAFGTNASERMRIDSNGRLLVGTSSSINFIGSTSAGLQTINTSTQYALGMERATNDTAGPVCVFRKTRSTTNGGNTIVSSGDDLGYIRFAGTDGSAARSAAEIKASVDGTPGSSDMPGRLVFSTTADGASSVTERMRIDSSGDVQARRARSNTTGDVALSVQPSDSTIHYGLRIDSTNNSLNLDKASGTAANLLVIDSSGNVLINTTTLPTSDSKLTVENSGSACEINVISGTSSGSVVNMGDTDDYNDGRIKYDNSSRSMQFQTANSERMRIDSSGRVGIGTTSPNVNGLHVRSSSEVFLRLDHSTTNTWDISNDSNLMFSRGGTERMRIDSSGNVGIGTSSPGAKQEILHTSGLPVTSGTTQTHGALRFSASGSNIVLDIGNSGSTGAWLQVGNKTSLIPGNSQELLLNPNGGNVGIGTTSPGENLVVRGSQPFLEIRDSRQQNWSGNDVFSGILFGTDDTTTAVDPHAFIKAVHTRTGSGHSSADAGLTFGTSASTSSPATERMRIDSSGNVGIGGANCTTKIDVRGTSNTAASTIQTVGNGVSTLLLGQNSDGGVIRGQGGNNVLAFWTGGNADMAAGGSGSERMRIDSSGNVGIGTTTINARLTVNGTLRFQTGNNPIALLTGDGDGTNCFKIDSNSAVGNGSGLVRVLNNGTQKARIEGDGSFQSATNSYGALSDVSLKENIVDADIQWADIKNIQVRNFNFKEAVGHGTSTQLGVIAQEVESVSPGLVKIDSDGVKSVKYSVLYMKAVKALQEAMERIETLETKVAALEAE